MGFLIHNLLRDSFFLHVFPREAAIRGERFVITRAQMLPGVYYLCFRSPSWVLIGCGFATAQPGGSGGCSIHEAVNAGVPASSRPSEFREQGGRMWNCAAPCWGAFPGSSWPQQTFWNTSEPDFLFLVLCLCEIECVNPVTEGLEREKSR